MLISLDTETTGIDLKHGAKPFIVTTFDGGENKFWEWDVDPFTRKVTIPKSDIKAIQKLIDSAETIVCHNLKFDARVLQSIGILIDWKKTEDTIIGGHLEDSSQYLNLTDMTLKYLGEDILPLEKRMQEVVNEARKKGRALGYKIAQKGLEEMPSVKGSEDKPWKFDTFLPRTIARIKNYADDNLWWRVTNEYANCDSITTYFLWLKIKEKLESKGLWKIYRERMKLPSIVAKVEDVGITIRKKEFEVVKSEFTEEKDRKIRVCKNISNSMGFDLELDGGITKNFREFCVHKEGLNLTEFENKDVNIYTETGMLSISQKVLPFITSQLSFKEPRGKRLTFLKSFADKQKLATALAFTKSYERFWIPDGDVFRLFPQLNPTATSTLRCTSGNPNAQQVSKQEGYTLRGVFGPAPGREWWSMDYDNIELRIPAYESNEMSMIELFEKGDEPPYFGSNHLLTASIIYPDLFWPLADKKGEFKKRYGSSWYQWTKNFNFAIQYGAGEKTADLAAHKPGCWKLMKSKLKRLSDLNSWCIRFAVKNGYIETLPDKTVDPKRGYPLSCIGDDGRVSPTIPLNYRVQGSAMWSTTTAMPRCQDLLNSFNKGKPKISQAFIIMQVHDELVFDFPKGGIKNYPIIKRLGEEMERSGDNIGIPLKVSINYHPNNWRDSETVST